MDGYSPGDGRWVVSRFGSYDESASSLAVQAPGGPESRCLGASTWSRMPGSQASAGSPSTSNGRGKVAGLCVFKGFQRQDEGEVYVISLWTVLLIGWW